MNIAKKELKIYLLIAFLLMLLIAMGTSYIYYLVKKDIPEPSALSQKAISEAEEFGKKRNNQECIEESLRKMKACDISEIKCRVYNKIFLKHCLGGTKKSNELCNEILNQHNNQSVKTGRWVSNTCANHPEIHNIVCDNTLKTVEDYCGLVK